MTGETFALLAALSYGVASVTIVKGRATARADNGVFLSVVATAGLTWLLWLAWGEVAARDLLMPDNRRALGAFAVAGLFSTVLGRLTMYRATELIGAVRASLLRRLTPVFTLFCAFWVLAEVPDARMLWGGAIILAGVLCYRTRSAGPAGSGFGPGVMIGIGSAFFYAVAYTLRSLGLGTLPDAALGTCVGALVGMIWFLLAASLRLGPVAGIWHLLRDCGRWQWITALALSLGQTLQFFALKSAPVSVVAVLGTLEVVFAGLLVAAFVSAEPISRPRLTIASLMALVGTAVLVS